MPSFPISFGRIAQTGGGMSVDFRERTARLIGKDACDRLATKAVAIFGVGGVGGHVVEALARAGVGKFLLVDADVVEESNINRQIVALRSTIGCAKVDVMAQRIADINPSAQVDARRAFYLPSNADEFDLSGYDYIIDAVDTVAAKVELVLRAKRDGVPIICSGGAGNKLDPVGFSVVDLAKTEIDPLCRALRKKLMEHGIRHVPVVFSREIPSKPFIPADEVKSRKVAPGSISFVPAVCGLVIAGYVVRTLLQN